MPLTELRSSQGNELDLQALTKEDPLLTPSPVDILLCHLHLQVARGRGEEIDQGPDCTMFSRVHLIPGLQEMTHSAWPSWPWRSVT